VLDPSQYAQIPTYAGTYADTVLGITLPGWGIGGAIGGVLADYLGRQSHDDAGYPCLLHHDRPLGVRLRLAIIRAAGPLVGIAPRFDADGDALEHVRY